ncbi:tyrosine-type recombinase/integrase [Streptomyces sp. NPDC001312]|uniref:tyrosine-type recombinase/integrase n=1 Tax=Streptomyces sp. NPDC001312 TaxID=3364561 RepID=UPI0036878C2D
MCARAGVRKVRFHDLRHTCASLLHEQGADASMIMEALGHSSIRVTMDIYTFVRLDSQRSAFDRVGDALRGGCGSGRSSPAVRQGGRFPSYACVCTPLR